MGIKLIVLDKKGKFEFEIQINKNTDKRVLDLILDENKPILFGCFGGSCGTCKCKIIKGDELIEKESVKNASYSKLEEKDFLPCIAKIKKGIKSGEIIIQKYL